jgi:VanZ family protein
MSLQFPERWRGRIIRYAPLFLWTGAIFFLSSSMGAASNTSRFIRPFLEWLFAGASAETITLYHAYVRKLAHFTEYAILAFWAWRAFRNSQREVLQKYRVVAAFLMVAAVASIDEFNQSFNRARTGSVYDVLLDVAGGVTIILVIWVIEKSKKRRRSERPA